MTAPTRKHRAPDRIAALEAENAALRKAAGHLTESILRGIEDATALDDVQQQLTEEKLRNAALEAENARLRAERVDASVFRKQLGIAEEHIRKISGENLALKADIANRDAITVPPMVRDIGPDDQATTPIDVGVLRRTFTVQTLPNALGGAA